MCVWVFYSSMYFDEDGDLAHEFYVEQRVQIKAGVVRWVMRKVSPSNLTPQVRTPSLSLSISPHSIFTAYLHPNSLLSREKWTSHFQDSTQTYL